MNLNLPELIKDTRNYTGLLRKGPIKEVFEKLILDQRFGPQLPNFGEDAAVIPWKGGFLLLAADGIMARLLINEPYAAGKSAVMVTVNDIYSMGGKPIAMVNVLASSDENHRAEVVEGIRKGCEKLRVPMVGGHLHPDVPTESPSLSVAILGWTNKVLWSHLAQSGDDLVLAVDLNGQVGCYSVKSWDANSGKSAEQLLYRLEVLPLIAERELAHTAKDISNAGILGTLSIMMENSGKGAIIDLPSIPMPSEIDFLDWLVSFQSYGFILSVSPDKSEEVITLFRSREITAAVIGKVVNEPTITVRNDSEAGILFDFNNDKITGIVYQGEKDSES
jgi:selenophosphate synthetase-related protein